MPSVIKPWILTLVTLLYAVSATAQKPDAPRSVEAIAASETQIHIYWLPPSDSGLTFYRLFRDGAEISSLPADAKHYTDNGLTPGSTHRYTLRAVYGDKESASQTCLERTDPVWPADLAGGKRRSLPTRKYDVLVVQASSGGVAAAIEAARRGLRVALIEPTARVGGMPSNGLSASDIRRAEHGSGFFVRFRDKVAAIYAGEGVRTNGISYEPRVAHEAMKSLLYEQAGIDLFKYTIPVKVLTHQTADAVAPTHVDGVVVEQKDRLGKVRRAEIDARIVVDATDCGDIAAWAGAPFRLGREPKSASEPHNGMIYYDRANDKALPGSTGKGDSRIQAYSYLLTVKDYGAGNDKTIPRPEGYHKEDFIHTPGWKQSWAVTSGTMPGSKLELNQHPQGGDIQGLNYRYPLMSYRDRARFDDMYRNHVLGYLYYIQTEQGQKQVGLPDDEYRDSGGFPPLLYVREGRRIIGDQLPLEKDVTDATTYTRPESIGIGDYPMDSHAVRPKTNWSTPDMGEGEWWLYKQTPVHQLPIGVILPKTLSNVFVTTAVSSTHVSFGTYRLEPVRMAFGEAAGIGADLCIRFGLSVHALPARQIQDELLPHAANRYPDRNIKLSYYPDVKADNAHFYAIQYLTTHGIRLPGDNFKPTADTTFDELKLLLKLVAARSNGITGSDLNALLHRAYLGQPASATALKELDAAPSTTAAVTRSQLADWLVRIFPDQVDGVTAHLSHYSDGSAASNPDKLYAMGIDSLLWDGVKAMQPDGKLLFHGDAAVTHIDLFAALYIAQIGLGPLFDDHPLELKSRR